MLEKFKVATIQFSFKNRGIQGGDYSDRRFLRGRKFREGGGLFRRGYYFDLYGILRNQCGTEKYDYQGLSSIIHNDVAGYPRV